MNRIINLCPFCGGKGKLIKEQEYDYNFSIWGDYKYFVRVQCKSCGATGKKVKVSQKYCANQEAIQFWNKRARV